jgi:hypothetical protein
MTMALSPIRRPALKLENLRYRRDERALYHACEVEEIEDKPPVGIWQGQGMHAVLTGRERSENDAAVG